MSFVQHMYRPFSTHRRLQRNTIQTSNFSTQLISLSGTLDILHLVMSCRICDVFKKTDVARKLEMAGNERIYSACALKRHPKVPTTRQIEISDTLNATQSP